MGKLIIAGITALLLAAGVGAANATPQPPTNGGSHLGGGQSGQCTGDLASRPATCLK